MTIEMNRAEGIRRMQTPQTLAEVQAYAIGTWGSLSVELRKRHGHPSWPHPQYVEWMMGFPTGWTDLQPSETP